MNELRAVRPDAEALLGELTLERVLESIWQSLEAAVKQRHSTMHTGIVSTIYRNAPQSRTVVLRRVITAERRLFFHTDVRSWKVEALTENPNIAWLFYDPQTRIQLRLNGVATLHRSDALADEHWAKTQLMSRRCYLTLPPSTPLETASSGLPEFLLERNPTLAESEEGRKNFLVISSVIHTIDWLTLNTDGHQRALFLWENETLFSQWIAP
jgi:pyridoxine/pyridoxamine 5'-phosphate oxidase